MSKYKIVPRVRLINENGVVEFDYGSIEEAAEALLPLRYKISLGEFHHLGFYDPLTVWRRKDPERYDYILRDDRGRHLSWSDLNAAWDRLHPKPKIKGNPWIRHCPEHAPGGKDYRRAPVEDVRCRRGGRCSGYRRGHGTMREWAETEALLRDEELLEHGDLTRRKRREALRFINDWDGPWRTDWRERSWKRHRRNQWKTT